ncbi:ATP-binding protein [Mesorhizobium sp.]|uniref:ATP-binding protein n=1 Tax=Mesorhizobium sp. TaxID=1871066 RepID=UPI0025C70467|nr:ATP-binding protein [Mesorhizobium sp.]
MSDFPTLDQDFRREHTKRYSNGSGRLDDSRSRAGGGSGLGLSVVRAIARAHGGDAMARSEPEGGTIIEIRLPLTPAGRRDAEEG